MKEREFSKTILKASLGASIVLTVLGFVLKDNQEENCNNVIWKEGSSGFISSSSPAVNIMQGGHLEFERVPHAFPGITIRWTTGEKIGEKPVPRGDLTICPRDTDTLISTRDGRQWVLPITNDTYGAPRIENKYIAVGYWVEQKETYKPGEDARAVILMRSNGSVTILETIVSPYAILAVTDDEIVYNISSEKSYEKRVLYNDGKELTLLSENW